MSTRVIILAGGKGTRMGSHLPKPIVPLNGRPVVSFLLDSVKESGVSEKPPVIVVGASTTLIQETLGTGYEYVVQHEQLGTGHAVKVCREALEGKTDSVIVLYADQPLITADAICSLKRLHDESGATMSMLTTVAQDFIGWRKALYSYGRVKRDADGKLTGIVELKDCTEEEKAIREVSPSFFCFNAEWLWKNLENLRTNNAQGEYYLTDLVGLAFLQGEKVASTHVDSKVAIGVNTPDELLIASSILVESASMEYAG